MALRWGWCKSVTNLRAIQNLAAKYGKLFAVLETAWTATNYDSDGTDNNISDFNNVTGLYDVSPQGQVDALSAE
ncbi:arabinogalactan endo-1,4-beta-galactosidase [Weissella beninensis]|uniref:Arabinogalactan endo-beta-1,4-galactanase n=1 Tax=Periweissella beninensis TaxID=504936 RepID=A0ABT0VHM5_9LACO|nr:arabinogalactan endo-1,4-beta-galactosidase [Periweissella beninensis]MCM2437342.1 glycosyl hydrolase 53 family protein [Periweissella beninensis]